MACGVLRAENVFPKKSRFRQNLAENLLVIEIAELIPYIFQAVSRFPGPMFEHACCHLGPPVAPPRWGGLVVVRAGVKVQELFS